MGIRSRIFFIVFSLLAISISVAYVVSERDLSRNINTYYKENPFKCNFCAKYFSQEQVLYQHVKTTFQCNLCTKTFFQEEILSGHINNYSEENSFKCNLCAK